MADSKSTSTLTKLVELLSPLSSEERVRHVNAAMVFLGEAQSASESNEDVQVDSLGELPARARAWMKQNSITAQQLHQVFHLSNGVIDLIAPLPGKSKKEQTYNAYIIAGVGQLLLSGEGSFDDSAARSLCERSGCYDSANHSAHLRNRGNEFTGSKERGWMLTAPGLARAAAIVKEMAST